MGKSEAPVSEREALAAVGRVLAAVTSAGFELQPALDQIAAIGATGVAPTARRVGAAEASALVPVLRPAAVTFGPERVHAHHRPDGAGRWPPVDETPRRRLGGLGSPFRDPKVAVTPRPHPRFDDADG